MEIERITKASAFLMIGTALFFDVLQFMLGIFDILGVIPVIGIIFISIGWIFSFICSVYAWLTFFVWFKIKNVSTWESLGKYLPRLIILILVNLLELTPVGVFIPGLTISVAIIVFIVRTDDKHNTRIAEEALEVAMSLFLSYMKGRRGNARKTTRALDAFSFGPQELNERFNYFEEGDVYLE